MQGDFDEVNRAFFYSSVQIFGAFMQKIIEFRKRNFWSNQIDIAHLNNQIAKLNADGWKIVSMSISDGLFGGVVSYILFLDKAG